MQSQLELLQPVELDIGCCLLNQEHCYIAIVTLFVLNNVCATDSARA
jgi:hypothetical protein